MGFFVQALLVGLVVLGIYELMFPFCQKCRRRKPRWQNECSRCQQAAA